MNNPEKDATLLPRKDCNREQFMLTISLAYSPGGGVRDPYQGAELTSQPGRGDIKEYLCLTWCPDACFGTLQASEEGTIFL